VWYDVMALRLVPADMQRKSFMAAVFQPWKA
jgi:hypothetical protein